MHIYIVYLKYVECISTITDIFYVWLYDINLCMTDKYTNICITSLLVFYVKTV